MNSFSEPTLWKPIKTTKDDEHTEKTVTVNIPKQQLINQIDYLLKFKQIDELLRTHMDKNNLKDWNIDYMNSQVVYGRCDYKNKTIYLSKLHVLNSPEKNINIS